MLEAHERLTAAPEGALTLTLVLPYEARQKSRLRATTECGSDVGVFMPRGTILRDGDVLRASDGTLIRVKAADERVSEVRQSAGAADALTLLRAAYHLGNRHVPLQIRPDVLRYQHDHVLDDMVRGLGLPVTQCAAPFHPEPGAYHGHGHAHGHAHEHSHALSPPRQMGEPKLEALDIVASIAKADVADAHGHD